MVAEVSLMKLLSDECHDTLLMISQPWFRWWLGAVRKQAITWANVDPDLSRQMASLCLNELNKGIMSYKSLGYSFDYKMSTTE